MEGHALWQIISHNAYMVITIVGSLIVLGFVYRNRQRGARSYRRRARGEEE